VDYITATDELTASQSTEATQTPKNKTKMEIVDPKKSCTETSNLATFFWIQIMMLK
jgi:hypothetical protein